MSYNVARSRLTVPILGSCQHNIPPPGIRIRIVKRWRYEDKVELKRVPLRRESLSDVRPDRMVSGVKMKEIPAVCGKIAGYGQ